MLDVTFGSQQLSFSLPQGASGVFAAEDRSSVLEGSVFSLERTSRPFSAALLLALHTQLMNAEAL